MAPINTSFLALVLLLLLLFISSAFSSTFTITNKCTYTVWPGIFSNANAGTAPLSSTGFPLQTGESNTFSIPISWSGQLWGRTLCSYHSTGKFTCITGDCGSGTVECSGGKAAPPATLAEFILNGADGLDYYYVSFVDGYNLPMLVTPQGGTAGGNCTSTGCVVDLNVGCPSELKVTRSSDSVACKSACEAFGDPQYCCSGGAYSTPDTCKPTSYSEFFKSSCPMAHSYAYDGTSTFTCAAKDYLITFCPEPEPEPEPSTSQKMSNGQLPSAVDVSGVESSAIIRLSSQNFIVAAAIFIIAMICRW